MGKVVIENLTITATFWEEIIHVESISFGGWDWRIDQMIANDVYQNNSFSYLPTNANAVDEDVSILLSDEWTPAIIDAEIISYENWKAYVSMSSDSWNSWLSTVTVHLDDEHEIEKEVQLVWWTLVRAGGWNILIAPNETSVQNISATAIWKWISWDYQ